MSNDKKEVLVPSETIGTNSTNSNSIVEEEDDTTTEKSSEPFFNQQTIILKAPQREGLVSSTPDPTILRTYREHAKDVLSLAGPIILSEFFQNTLPIVDIAFVGNLPDKEDLAAAALATVWFNIWNATMLGFSTAIDTFLAQAYGANELKGFGLWTGTGLVIVMIVSIFVAGTIALCGPVMKLFGQDEILAERAGEFSYRLIPGLFPLYAFKVLLKYLQTQNIVMPGVWTGLWGNGVNILFNWLLIYKLDMGLNGAPWATSITRLAEFVVIVVYMLWNRHSEKLQSTWPRFSREMWNYETMRPFCKLALSGALSISAEAWSFEVATILAGLIGTVELDAHIITLTIASFQFYSFPFAIGVAASIRVGQWIGDGSPGNAQRSSVVSFLLSGTVQCILISIMLPNKEWIGDVFSSDDEVSDLVTVLIPVCCAFMLGDSVQATVGGVMRGLGRQRLVLFLNILGFWILAIPVGTLLTFVGDVGVIGMWWGYVIGIYTAGIVGVTVLKYRISWENEAVEAAQRLSTLSNVQLEPSLSTRIVETIDTETGFIEHVEEEDDDDDDDVIYEA